MKIPFEILRRSDSRTPGLGAENRFSANYRPRRITTRLPVCVLNIPGTTPIAVDIYLWTWSRSFNLFQTCKQHARHVICALCIIASRISGRVVGGGDIPDFRDSPYCSTYTVRETSRRVPLARFHRDLIRRR